MFHMLTDEDPTMTPRTAVAGALLGTLGACVHAPTVTPLPDDHPASALAPATPYEPAANPFNEVASDHPATSEYVCPMHPEVVSTSPGICPKCAMDLVPQAHDHGGGT